jgi:hypothetical protein
LLAGLERFIRIADEMPHDFAHAVVDKKLTNNAGPTTAAPVTASKSPSSLFPSSAARSPSPPASYFAANAATALSTAYSSSIYPDPPTAPSAPETPPPSQSSSASPPWASTSFSNNIPQPTDYSCGRTNNPSYPECDSFRRKLSSGYEMPLSFRPETFFIHATSSPSAAEAPE